MLATMVRVFILTSFLMLPAVARAEGWSFPKWMPFQSKSKNETPLDGGSAVIRNTAAGPSMGKQVADGTRKVVSGTVDLVTLKPVRNALVPKPKAKSAWKPYTPTLGGSSSSKNKKQSSWTSWFGGSKKSDDKRPDLPKNSWLFDSDRSRP